MNNLKIFENAEFGQIRTAEVDGEPWFVGKDVAEALGYAEPRSAVSKKVEEVDRGVAEMETPSGKQNMTIINESGLYALIFGSKLESAKRFKHWVTSEVLPAIRSIIQFLGQYEADRIGVEKLTSQSTAYSLMKAPQEHVEKFISGLEIHTDYYELVVRRDATSEAERISNNAWGQGIAEWISRKERTGDYPVLDG